MQKNQGNHSARVYYAVGIMLLFFSALFILNTVFSRRDSVENNITRQRAARNETLYDISGMKSAGGKVYTARTLYFYAPVYDEEQTVIIEINADGANESVTRSNPSDTPLNMITKAREALRGHKLFADFALYDTEYGESGSVTVRFYAEIDGVRDCAFPTAVTFNANNAAERIEMYSFKYERLGAVKVLDAETAVFHLPLTEERVTLETYELVYFFEDSVIQPAWLFKGAREGGAPFEAFTRAANLD